MPCSSRRSFLLLSGSACAFAPAARAMDALSSSAEALDRWYEQLNGQVELPKAPPGAVLPQTDVLTRIAIGSCNNQVNSQAFWDRIAARRPQLFLYVGDNVYGDPGWDGGADLGSLRRAYERLAGLPEFVRFRAQVPMMETWDDHDFGFNDGGGVFPFKNWSEHIFETFWEAGEDVRSRQGIYHSRRFGPEGRLVQILMLDTRYFRSSWILPERDEILPKRGRYRLDQSSGAQMLGEEQWRWLERELGQPADLRLIVSSIQVHSDAHRFEGWQLMPGERERLYAILRDRAGGSVVLLSGDRHAGGIYRKHPKVFGQDLWEMTASSLNQPSGTNEEATEREPDPDRVTRMIGDANFGEVAIDWDARRLTLSILGTDGALRDKCTVGFTA